MRAFLDSSAIIIGLAIEKSNSAKILDLLFNNKIDAAISEKVLKEVKKYFREKRSRNYAYMIELLLRKNCKIVYNYEVKEKMAELKGKIKDKDLEQLAVVKKHNLKNLVGFDRDFENFTEYIPPKQFIRKLNLEAYETEY
ncbi:PIN domain-containing protein [Candidatus Woesearchaeota archaeon]|nr:PIN domain-containing protein [Candidatus Woesearchaeota archaeon]